MTTNGNQVKPERTGWRDEKISLRHRLWGRDCPGVDIDFLLVEYNNAWPVALIEYKEHRAYPPKMSTNYTALSRLAGAAGLPFFVAYYQASQWWFQLYPMNEIASEIIETGQIMSEQEYVLFLYDLRNKVIQDHVLRNLEMFKPTVNIIRPPR